MSMHERIEAEWTRRELRRRLPLPIRLDVSLRHAAGLSDTGAAPVGRETARVKAGSSPPAPDNSLLTRYERKFKLLLEAFEKEIDAEKYRPTSADLPPETTQQREARLIRNFEGMPSHEVSFLDESFGSPRSIERIRSKHGRKPSDGILYLQESQGTQRATG
jgi:hypothetical protein